MRMMLIDRHHHSPVLPDSPTGFLESGRAIGVSIPFLLSSG